MSGDGRSAWKRRWEMFWFAPGGARTLAAARVLLSLSALWALWAEHPAVPGRLLSDVRLLPAEVWHPVGLLALVGARPPSQVLVDVVGAVALPAALLTLMGVHTRTSSAVLAITMWVLLGWTQSWGRVVHVWNLPTICLLALALTPSGEAWSWDARRQPDPTPDGRFTWSVRLLRLNIAMMWLLAGLSKVAYGGLDWVRPVNLRTILLSVNLTDAYRPASAMGLWIAGQPWLCSALAVATLLMELGFVGVLFVSTNRARLAFVLPAAGFLVGVALWMHLPQPAHLLPLLICLDWGALTGGQPEPAPLGEGWSAGG